MLEFSLNFTCIAVVTKNPRPTPANSRAEILESYLAFSISVSDNTTNMSPKAAANSGDAIPNNKEPKRQSHSALP